MKGKNFKLNSYTIVIVALSICINFIGTFLAIILRLPIYLDSIGTIFIALLMGPAAGAIAGVSTSVLNALTIDPISIYFLPVQLIYGIFSGILFNNRQLCFSIKNNIMIILLTMVGSIMASFVAAFVFNGITSSGSSFMVAILNNFGINLVTSVFSTQILTDFLDKFMSFGFAFYMIHYIPKKYTKLLLLEKSNNCLTK